MTSSAAGLQNKQTIIGTIRRYLPECGTIYLFGSRATDNYNAESDFDIAVIIEAPINPTIATQVKMELSAQLRHDIDFIDLRRADTVTNFHAISQGEVLWEKSPLRTAEYETVIYSQYASLNRERAEILQDIEEKGSIYGR
jgi:predicted nucleotidyltransferase